MKFPVSVSPFVSSIICLTNNLSLFFLQIFETLCGWFACRRASTKDNRSAAAWQSAAPIAKRNKPIQKAPKRQVPAANLSIKKLQKSKSRNSAARPSDINANKMTDSSSDVNAIKTEVAKLMQRLNDLQVSKAGQLINPEDQNSPQVNLDDLFSGLEDELQLRQDNGRETHKNEK